MDGETLGIYASPSTLDLWKSISDYEPGPWHALITLDMPGTPTHGQLVDSRAVATAVLDVE
jgi:hypothetical protein